MHLEDSCYETQLKAACDAVANTMTKDLYHLKNGACLGLHIVILSSAAGA